MTARRALSLLPPCATTGIGSLPHTQLELALQMSLQTDVPFVPQLPTGNPSELMIPAALDGLPGLSFDEEGMCTVEVGAWEAERGTFDARIDRAISSGDLNPFEPSPQACRAWRPFLWEVQQRKLPFAKIQIAGPATVRWVARTSDGLAASDAPALDQQMFRLILAKGLAMVKAVRAAGAVPLLYLDEPGLYALDLRNPRHVVVLQELKVMAIALQREGALVGLHCCSNTHWPSVLRLGLDIISLDVRLSLDALLEGSVDFLGHLMSGATVSLGVVPTDLATAYEVTELAESVEASLKATLPRPRAYPDVLAQALLTPACGLGMRSVSDAERIFGELREARRALLQSIQAERGESLEPAPLSH